MTDIDIADVGMDDFDVTSPAVLADAFAAYRALVARGPAFRSEAMGAVVVRDYQTVRDALNDARLSARHSVQQLGAGPAVDLGVFGRVSTLPTSDPPNHTRLRKLVNKAFTPSSVRAALPLCQRIVAGAVERAKDRGRLAVVADIAAPLPSQVIAGMLGVPDQDWPLFKKWSDDLFGAFKGSAGSTEELHAASEGAH